MLERRHGIRYFVADLRIFLTHPVASAAVNRTTLQAFLLNFFLSIVSCNCNLYTVLQCYFTNMQDISWSRGCFCINAFKILLNNIIYLEKYLILKISDLCNSSIVFFSSLKKERRYRAWHLYHWCLCRTRYCIRARKNDRDRESVHSNEWIKQHDVTGWII